MSELLDGITITDDDEDNESPDFKKDGSYVIAQGHEAVGRIYSVGEVRCYKACRKPECKLKEVIDNRCPTCSKKVKDKACTKNLYAWIEMMIEGAGDQSPHCFSLFTHVIDNIADQIWGQIEFDSYDEVKVGRLLRLLRQTESLLEFKYVHKFNPLYPPFNITAVTINEETKSKIITAFQQPVSESDEDESDDEAIGAYVSDDESMDTA